jgi:membrane protein
MNKLEQPLYPKLSPIYNKILQLLSAILLIVILMFFLVANTEKSAQTLEQHFKQVSEKFLQQGVAGVSAILNKKGLSNTKSQNTLLQSYVDTFAHADFIKQVHLYDKTGLLLFKSELGGEASDSIKLLYGIDESEQTLNKSNQYIPFIKEIRDEKLQGYFRLTIEKSYITAELSSNSTANERFSRLLLIIAGLIGFLLTRGLNRFSRQGYRAPKSVY